MSVSGLFCKDSASEWNDKTKYAVFVFHSRAPPILCKDSANRRQYKTSSLVFIVEMQSILFKDASEWKDSANERNVSVLTNCRV